MSDEDLEIIPILEDIISVGDLDKAVDFGWFDFIAKPCLWFMNFIYRIIPNYGVAIIILTIIIKTLLWPLGNKSYKSMNEMKKLQPLMAKIREKYKDDKKRMNEEIMGLYKTYKINPLGGCLPMLAQIPVFFALYRMLYEAVELRQKLQDKGILVRYFSEPRLRNYIRISVGKPEHTDALIECLRQM